MCETQALPKPLILLAAVSLSRLHYLLPRTLTRYTPIQQGFQLLCPSRGRHEYTYRQPSRPIRSNSFLLLNYHIPANAEGCRKSYS
jgi:hypothetical protein